MSGMRRIGLLMTALAAAAAWPAAASANLLINGDFESAGTHGAVPSGWNDSTAVASGPFGALNIGLYKGSDYIPCCAVFGSPGSLANSFAGFGVGDSDNAGGSLAQSFVTSASGAYHVSFDLGSLGAAPGQSFTVKIIDVLSSSVLGGSHLYFAPTNDNLDATFVNYAFDFTAIGAATRIVFTDTSPTSSIDGIVDNVSVAAVPEPSTWAMMLIGFAGLGFAGYKQAQRRPITA